MRISLFAFYLMAFPCGNLLTAFVAKQFPAGNASPHLLRNNFLQKMPHRICCETGNSRNNLYSSQFQIIISIHNLLCSSFTTAVVFLHHQVANAYLQILHSLDCAHMYVPNKYAEHTCTMPSRGRVCLSNNNLHYLYSPIGHFCSILMKGEKSIHWD